MDGRRTGSGADARAAGAANVDREAKTPRVSGNFATFYDRAREIEQKFANEATPLAIEFRAHARKLADDFASWPMEPPDVTVRSLRIQEIVDLNGEVHAYASGEQQALDLLARMNVLSVLARKAPFAQRLAEEIEHVAEDFALWRSERPPDSKIRAETMQALVTLSDQVNAFLRGER